MNAFFSFCSELPFFQRPFIPHTGEKYGKDLEGVQIYKMYHSGAILRMADRMKLVQIIMERSRGADLASGARGAG
jgi:hypothetical protein